MRNGEQGHTLVAVLVLTAMVAIAVSVVGPVWSQLRQREREAHLARVGRVYAAALASYRRLSPGPVPESPASLDDLLLDRRFVGTVRHLRRLYPDPMTRGESWLVIRDERGRIVGVRSSSGATPVALVPPAGARWFDREGGRSETASPPASLPASQTQILSVAIAPLNHTYAHWAFLAEDAP